MNSGGGVSALDNQSMDPGELPVSLRGCPAGSMLPRAEPGHATRGEGRGKVWKVVSVLPALPV